MPISLTQGPWLELKIFQKTSNDTSLETALKYEQNGVFIRCFSPKAAEINVSNHHHTYDERPVRAVFECDAFGNFLHRIDIGKAWTSHASLNVPSC